MLSSGGTFSPSYLSLRPGNQQKTPALCLQTNRKMTTNLHHGYYGKYPRHCPSRSASDQVYPGRFYHTVSLGRRGSGSPHGAGDPGHHLACWEETDQHNPKLPSYNRNISWTASPHACFSAFIMRSSRQHTLIFSTKHCQLVS